MKIGQKLKDINFITNDNDNFAEKDLVGKKLIIYFYPKDDTPGCTKEAIDFSDHIDKFTEHDSNIFGVSKDTVEKHNKFISKYNLKINLISDVSLEICKKFNTWVEKSMYGKKYMGIERATFVFDKDLVLIKSWRNVKVKGHVDEVLNFIINQA